MKKTVFAMMAAAMAAAMPASGQSAEKRAVLAGGCFWCMESDFENVPGVTSVVSGYTGGTLENPTYKNHSGHVEAVEITYDDAAVTYGQLLHTFWRSVDPTDAGGQFCDRGHSYTTAIFPLDEAQMKEAQMSKADLEASGKLADPVVTPIIAATEFTVAEDYHQSYYKKNPVRYSFYRKGCGRDARIDALWGEEAHSGIAPHS